MSSRPTNPTLGKFVRMGVFTLAYGGTLVISLRLLAGGIESQPLRVAISLAPMVPALWLCLSVAGTIRQMDEMQRQIQLEALAMAFAGTALVTFSYGFLENVGFPPLNTFMIWPLMSVLWLLGQAISRLRYR